MAKKICQLYLPAFKRSYVCALQRISNILGPIKNAGCDGIYLIALWQDGGYDNGFDIIDYVIDPQLGTDEDLIKIIQTAHKLDMSIGVDVVPNHVSDRNVLALGCLHDIPEYEDCLYVVDQKEADRLTKAGVPSFFGRLAYSDFGDKYVRSSFADYGQLNVNWESKKVQKYFKHVFSKLERLKIDFARIDCGPLLLEDVSKADPNNPMACMRPKESIEAIREVSGDMPLFFEWFDPSSADLFNDMDKCWALDCEHCLTGKFNVEWNHQKLIPVFGGHDQMTFHDRDFPNPDEILKRAEQQKYIFTDMQTLLKWRTEETILPGDQEYDANLENPNQRYRARRPIAPVMEAFLQKYN